MNLRRIAILFGKEARQGATSFFAVFAVLMPLVLSLLLSLVFGDVFSELPRLGLLDQGNSQMIAMLTDEDHLQTTVYTDEEALRTDVTNGAVTLGLIIPEGFDQALRSSETAELRSLRWGEGLLKDQAVIGAAVARAMAQVSGVEMPLTLEAQQLGEADIKSWSQRLLPLLVLMAVVFSGMIVPASSLVEEKQRKTLSSLTVTPVSLLEVYVSKALLGTFLGVTMGVVILAVNGALGSQPGLLLFTLGLSAMASSVFGVLLGSLVHEVNTFFAVVKATGILLYAPGFLELIPRVPEWVAKVLPTYYVMNPVLKVSQNAASLGQISGDLLILLAMTAGAILAVAALLRRQQEQIGISA